MKDIVTQGNSSKIYQIFIRNSATGAGLTGLVYNSTGLVCYYHKDSQSGGATQVNLVTMTIGTYTSSGFVEIDSTNLAGWYQFCPPSAALSSGTSCAFLFSGGTNGTNSMVPCPFEVDITLFDLQTATQPVNATQWSGSAVATPNVSGVPIVDIKYLLGTVFSTPATSGIMDVNVKNYNNHGAVTDGNNYPSVNIVDIAGTASSGTAGYVGLDWGHITAPTTTVSLSGTTIGTLTTYTGNTPQTGDSYARLGAPAGASIAADLAEIEGETDTIIAGVNVTQINGDSTAATNLAAGADAVITGTAITGTLTSTSCTVSGNAAASVGTDAWKGRNIYFTSGTAQGGWGAITAYNASTGLITFSAGLSNGTTPANNDKFVIA